MKKLYKSENDKVLSGVIGGIGEYYDTDPTLLRLVFILVTILTGIFPFIIGYIIAAIIVPDKPRVYSVPPIESKAETKASDSVK
jgi:phage shock protein C